LGDDALMLAKHASPALYCGAQVIGVTALMAIVTFIAVWLDAPPNPWNAIWMTGPPLILGLALNRGTARIVMAGLLFTATWAVIGVVGTAMGGM